MKPHQLTSAILVMTILVFSSSQICYSLAPAKFNTSRSKQADKINSPVIAHKKQKLPYREQALKTPEKKNQAPLIIKKKTDGSIVIYEKKDNHI